MSYIIAFVVVGLYSFVMGIIYEDIVRFIKKGKSSKILALFISYLWIFFWVWSVIVVKKGWGENLYEKIIESIFDKNLVNKKLINKFQN